MTSETHENPALTPIFARAVTLAVKGPGVLSGYVFLRGAAAAASWLPPLMVIMALVRMLRTAPKDAMGEPRFMDMLSAMLSEPLFLAGAVGIYVSIVAIRAVLLALAEAGLCVPTESLGSEVFWPMPCACSAVSLSTACFSRP